MRNQIRGLVTLTALPVLLAALAPATAVAGPTASGYLNLHQCVFRSAATGEYFTNVLPNIANTAFRTGTSISNRPDTSMRCDLGSAGYWLAHPNSGITNLGLAGGRYLNLHQCVYRSETTGEYFTNVLPNIENAAFNTGSNVSNRPDTSVQCGPGAGAYTAVSQNSEVTNLDLTSGRYLNLHQCVYRSEASGEYFTNVLPNIANTAFKTGTNVSNRPQTSVQCGLGAGAYTAVSHNSAVLSLDLVVR